MDVQMTSTELQPQWNVITVEPKAGRSDDLRPHCFYCNRYFAYREGDSHTRKVCRRCLLCCRKCGVFMRERVIPYSMPSIKLSEFTEERRQKIQAMLNNQERLSEDDLEEYYGTLTKDERSLLELKKCLACHYKNIIQERAKEREIDKEFEKHLASQTDTYERIEWSCVDCKSVKYCYAPIGFPRKATAPLDDVCQECTRARIFKRRDELLEKRRQELRAFEASCNDEEGAVAKNTTVERYFLVEKRWHFGNLYQSTHLYGCSNRYRGPNLEKADDERQVQLCEPFVQQAIDECVKRGLAIPQGIDPRDPVPYSWFLVKAKVPRTQFEYTTNLPDRLWGRHVGNGLRSRYSMFLANLTDRYRKLSRSEQPHTSVAFTAYEHGALLSLLRPSVVPAIDNYHFAIYGSSTFDKGEALEDLPRRPSTTNPFEPEDVDFEEDKSLYNGIEMHEAALALHRASKLVVFDANAYLKGNHKYKIEVEYPAHRPELLSMYGSNYTDSDSDDSD